MKYSKIIGLSIFLASSVGIIASAKNSKPSTIITNNDVYQDFSSDPVASDGYCLLTFDAGEGKYTATGATQAFFQVRKGHNWGRIKSKTGIKEDGTDLTPTGENTVFKFYQTKNNKAIFDEYVFNEDNVTLTAKWGQKYQPTTFSTDPWDQVVEAADNGYDELVSKYITGKGLKNDSFIISDLNDGDEVKSKTRYVNIEGLINPLYGHEKHPEIQNPCDWPVHVVGINHDLIKDSPKSVAALTFEFSYAPIASYGWDYSSSAGHKSWDNSTLKTSLNSYLYFQIEDKLQSGIQTVRKNTDDGTNQGVVGTYDEKLFIQSVSEMTDVFQLRSNKINASSYENSRYEFYDNNKYPREPQDILKKTPYRVDEATGNPMAASAWLRSPSASASDIYNSSTATIIAESTAFVDVPVTEPHIVCPCFAIGESKICAVSSNMDDGLTFEAIDYFARENKDFEARIRTTDPIGGYRAPANLDGKIKVTTNGEEKTLVEGTDYEYNNGTGALTIKAKEITANTTLISIKASPQMNEFQAASWDELAEEAEKGILSLKNRYHIEDFVTQQKYLTIDGVKYRTRVIDEAHDILADGTDKAALTFEFIDAIGAPGCYDNKTNENFPESQLNFRLSSFAQDKMPFKLAEVTKSVTIKTDGEWTLTDYPTKLFPLSTTEYSDWGQEVDAPEGDAYKFTDYSYGYEHINFKYLPGTTKSVPVWLRTPNANSSEAPVRPNNCIKISEVDGRSEYIALCTDTDAYVAPGFCIGRAHEVANITFSGAIDSFTINGQEPQTIPDIVSGGEYTIENIAAKEIGGVTPTITNNNIFMTCNGSQFNEWSLIPQGDGNYSITINEVPTGDVDINITFPDTCLSFSFDKSVPYGGKRFELGFTEGNSAPDTQLSYSYNGEDWFDYEYNYPVLLEDYDNGKVYFKAKDGANNTHFANVTDFSSELDQKYITHFSCSTDDPESRLRVEGNIMSLLGNGTRIPSTVSASGAFYGMFADQAYIKDASGLVLPATGTESDEIEASGTYAYMFARSWLTKAPAKIIGFNNYTDGYVTDTYHSMFLRNSKLEDMPYCDFSRTCPHMCENMFYGCTNMNDTNNVTTRNFNNDYSDSCFKSMFWNVGTEIENGKIEVPDSIGSSEIDAAVSCCESMYYGSNISKTPNMMCNKPTVRSFAACFANCPNILEASLTVNEIDAVTTEYYNAPYYDFLAITGGGIDHSYMKRLYIYGLESLDVWPVSEFDYMLDGRVDDGKFNNATLYAKENVINAIRNAEFGHGGIPKEWNLEIMY